MRKTFEINYVDADGPVGAAADRHVLASVRFGPHAGALPEGGLSVHVPLQQLGPGRTCELWTCDDPCQLDESRGFRLADTGRLLAGALEVDGSSLEEDTYLAHRRMLQLVDERGRHLLRVWNIVPDLHAGPSDLTRYMLFCRGRARAYEDHHGPGFESRLCASTAVGSGRGPQVLYFLASNEAGTPLGNARQVHAYRYPPRYGPRSPSFARATYAHGPVGDQLFLSGTASIVGHQSVHLEDVRAQTLETLRNIRILLGGEEAAEELCSQSLPLIKVYLRRGADLDFVRRVVVEAVGAETPAIYLRADVCRPELLIEIEGVGRPSSYSLVPDGGPHVC